MAAHEFSSLYLSHPPEHFGSNLERRRELFDALDKIWAAYPSLRFAQMLTAAVGDDPFYVEDSRLLGYLQARLLRLTQKLEANEE